MAKLHCITFGFYVVAILVLTALSSFAVKLAFNDSSVKNDDGSLNLSSAVTGFGAAGSIGGLLATALFWWGVVSLVSRKNCKTWHTISAPFKGVPVDEPSE